MAVIAW